VKTSAKFDLEKFSQAQFTPRQEEVSLPALGDFFDGDPIWVVRGLTANEIARANDSAARNTHVDSMIKAITSASKSKQVEEFRKAFGVSDDVHDEIIKRMEHLVIGSIEPKIELPIAVKLPETFPIEFYDLTNKIMRLSGMGMEVEKPKPSGEAQG